MSACDCCDAPPLPSILIECDSVSASKSKSYHAQCGELNPADGKYYLTIMEGQTGWGPNATPDPPPGCVAQVLQDRYDPDLHEHIIIAREVRETVAPDCTINKGGKKVYSVDEAGNCTGPEITSGVPSPCRQIEFRDTITVNGTWGVFHDWALCCVEELSGRKDYSDEAPPPKNETTGDLISRTLSDLPSYPDKWGGSCSSYRNLSPDESSYSIQKFKWRLAHPPTGTCYLKVWLQKRFHPETGTDTVTPLAAYEWTGSGSPCFTDATKGVDHADNRITGEPSEEDIPATDGTTTIEIVKFSCIPGYEPDISDPENPQPNGFPDPAWEAAAP